MVYFILYHELCFLVFLRATHPSTGHPPIHLRGAWQPWLGLAVSEEEERGISIHSDDFSRDNNHSANPLDELSLTLIGVPEKKNS